MIQSEGFQAPPRLYHSGLLQGQASKYLPYQNVLLNYILFGENETDQLDG